MAIEYMVHIRILNNQMYVMNHFSTCSDADVFTNTGFDTRGEYLYYRCMSYSAQTGHSTDNSLEYILYRWMNHV